MNSEERGPADAPERRGATGAAAGAPSIPDYALLRRIGQGGYGEVWLARGLTGVLRAVKIVWRARFVEAEPYEREFRGVKAAMTQAIEAGQLALLHVGQDEAAGFFYYVMELADDATAGRAIVPETYVPLTWKELKQRRGRLPAAECLRLAVAVTRSLAGLHRRGLVHRDIKPSNIVQISGEPKLADVGLVASSADARTFVGTTGYLPPEGPGSPAADVFALGRVLYELATGCDRDDYPQLPRSFESAAERKAFFRLNQVIVRAGEPQLGARFQDAGELLAALEEAGRGRLLPGWAGWRAAATLAVGAAVVAGGWWGWPRERREPAQAAAPTAAKEEEIYARSIAVLPFASLSADPANAFFTDGVHEDVLVKLTSIPELRVVSRTTVLGYRDTKKSAREIGRELAVAYLLEGTVRREGAQVRLSGQLIDVRHDRPVKALNYTRPLADIFSLQADLAEMIAGELKATLTPEAKAVLERPLTTNPVAYDEYLKGRAAMKREPSRELAAEAERMFARAVELDPQFAAAWGELANVHSSQIFQMTDMSPARRAKADEAMAQALRLAPDTVETWRAQGIYFYQRFRDFNRAEEIFQKLRRRLPNDGSVCFWLGVIQRRNLRWPESTANLQRATELEPSSGTYSAALMQSYSALRRVQDTLAEERRWLALVKKDPAEAAWSAVATKYRFAMDPAEPDRELEALPPELARHPAVLGMKRDRAFERGDLATFRRYDEQVLQVDESERDGELEVAQQYAALGDPVAAKRRLGQVAERLRARVTKDPGAAFAWGRLAQAEALAGNREEALRCARQSAAAMSESTDAYFGPQISSGLAETMAWCGETDWALAELRRLVRNPASYLSAPNLARRVRFEPLKSDPRFRALVDAVARYTPLSGEVTPEMSQPHPLPERLAEPAGAPYQLPGRGGEAPAAVRPAVVNAIAVLPLVNVSGDREQEYFADGLTDEIITVLAREPGLQVTGRSSAFYYKGRNVPAGEIGRALSVGQLVEGSVRRMGNRVRIAVQLTQAASGYSESLGNFDRDLTDVFALQEEVARAVLAKVTGRDVPPDAARVPVLTKNTEAYAAYLRGKTLRQQTAANARPAIEQFQKAVALDPQFALAWAEMAWAYFLDASVHVGIRDTIFPKCAEAAERALQLQPGLPQALIVRSNWRRAAKFDFPGAAADLAQAEAQAPGTTDLRVAQANLARDQGDWETSLACLERAVTLDPNDGVLVQGLALSLAMRGRLPEADRFFARAAIIQAPASDAPVAARRELRLAWRGPEAAIRLLDRLPPATDDWEKAYLEMEHLRLRGQYQEAAALARVVERRADENGEPKRGGHRIGLSDLMAVDGADLARARAEGLFEEWQKRYDAGERGLAVLSLLTRCEIALGHQDRALALLAEWRQTADRLPSYYQRVNFLGPSIGCYARLGRAEEAVGLMRDFWAHGYRTRVVPSEFESEVAPLRGNARFEAWAKEQRAFFLAQPDPEDDPQATSDALRRAAEERIAATGPKADLAKAGAAAVVPENATSIAVLPLDNLSPESGDAYLTEGLHAEIIATLGRSAEVRVITRGSTLAFKGTTERLAEVGRKLGVGYVVTGSLRRQGSRVRIALELRRAADEALLWSPVFDRETADAFALQEEVADAVARQLQARERKGTGAGARFMTKVPQAYDLYLRASELVPLGAAYRAEGYRERLKLAEQAYALDKNFMPAAELCARLNLSVYRLELDPTARAKAAAEAKRWAELASRLAPGGPGDGALSEYCLWVERDHRRALALAEGQVRALPNEALARERVAKALAALGRVAEAVEAEDRALELDPLNFSIRHNQIVHLAYLRRTAAFETAVKNYELLAGDNADGVMILGYRFMVSGVLPANVDGFKAYGRGLWFTMKRRFADQLANAEEKLQEPGLPDEARHLWFAEKSDALRGLGRKAEAEAAGREMLAVAEKLAAQPSLEPGEGDLLRLDALARAGHRAEALTLGRRFVAEKNEADEPAERWNREWRFALVCAVLGEKEECLGLLEKLIRVPWEITLPELRLDPIWDPVREEPRFKALLADPRNAWPDGETAVAGAG